MRRYETIFIVKPNAGEDDITELTDKVSAIITTNSGTVVKIDKWGLRKLAYPIAKETQGYYVYTDYAATPASVVEIERILKIDDRALKFMTVKLSDTFDPADIVVEEEVEEEAAEANDSVDEVAPAAQEETEEDVESKDSEG